MQDHPRRVTVFGGSGFAGRHIVGALARQGHRIIAAVRRPDLAGHLQPLGEPGQIRPIQANVRMRWSVDRAVEGADVVINLTGTFDAGGANNFDAIHVSGARAVAEAARAAGARLIHMSAIGADADSPSAYGCSKAEGEAAVLDTLKRAIIMRPSIVFGPEDGFFNRFAAMATLSPVLPLIGGGKMLLQPVYVADVASAFAAAVGGRLKGGRVYELGGPETATFRECMDLMQDITDRSRLYLPVPWFATEALAKLTDWIPGAPITRDQVKMLAVDNVVSEPAARQGRTLEGMGIAPRTMRSVLPSYLVRFRPHGQFTRKGAA